MKFKNKEELKKAVDNLYEFGLFKTDSEELKKTVLASIEKYLTEHTDENTPLIIDHTNSLLEEARKYKRNEQFEFARIFYQAYFEHSINQLIFYYCVINNINHKDQIEIIRSVNIKGKFSWLLKVLGFPRFKKSHFSTISRLSEKRNSFVHYKWKKSHSFNELIDSKQDEIIKEEFKEIEKTIRYFKTYNKRARKNDVLGIMKDIISKQKI